jgi:hypothetical protein
VVQSREDGKEEALDDNDDDDDDKPHDPVQSSTDQI